MYPEEDDYWLVTELDEDSGAADQTYDVLQNELLDVFVRTGNGA